MQWANEEYVAEADAFCEALALETNQPPADAPLWLRGVERLPVTFVRGRPPMQFPILGVVAHTTNHQSGPDTLERFRRDWQAIQRQSTTFMVDREGRVGQFRTTRQGSYHIKEPKPRRRWDFHYFGIEHIARPDQALTAPQLERSAQLIGDLSLIFGFPARRLPRKGERGIGIHVDFNYTGCGHDVFWSGRHDQRTATYDRLVRRAHEFARYGF